MLKKILKLFKPKSSRINSSDNFPVEINDQIKKFINVSDEFSMGGKHRMYVLSQAIFNSKINKIEGDFIECGVWRGGNILLFKLLGDFYNLNKYTYAYDTFDGMTLPEDVDVDLKGNSASELMKKIAKDEKDNNKWCYSGIDEVKNNILKYSNLNNINFIKGPVEQTLLSEKNLPKKISVLRIDTDFYSSTKIELEILYPRLQSGGVLIIDDYGHWAGSRKAVDEYFTKKDWLHYVDYTCRYIIKP